MSEDHCRCLRSDYIDLVIFTSLISGMTRFSENAVKIFEQFLNIG